jgi:hypothetical protein
VLSVHCGASLPRPSESHNCQGEDVGTGRSDVSRDDSEERPIRSLGMGGRARGKRRFIPHEEDELGSVSAHNAQNSGNESSGGRRRLCPLTGVASVFPLRQRSVAHPRDPPPPHAVGLAKPQTQVRLVALLTGNHGNMAGPRCGPPLTYPCPCDRRVQRRRRLERYAPPHRGGACALFKAQGPLS